MSSGPVTFDPIFPRACRTSFLVLGVVLIILGLVAASVPAVAGEVSVMVLGFVFMVGGFAHGFAVFQARTWTGSFLHLLMGVLALAIGFFFFRHPGEALVKLTEVLAILFVIGGLFRIFGAFLVRHDRWVWNVISGVVSVLLGTLVLYQMPYSADWLIGLYVGIELLFQGIAAVGIATAIPTKPATV